MMLMSLMMTIDICMCVVYFYLRFCVGPSVIAFFFWITLLLHHSVTVCFIPPKIVSFKNIPKFGCSINNPNLLGHVWKVSFLRFIFSLDWTWTRKISQILMILYNTHTDSLHPPTYTPPFQIACRSPNKIRNSQYIEILKHETQIA